MNANDKDFDEILMENGEEPGEMSDAFSDEPTEGIVEGEILTTGSLAKFLGVKPEQIRYYAKVFSNYFSFTNAEEGTHRRYTPQDVKTMSTIVTLCSDQGLSTKEAKKRLDDDGYGATDTTLTKLANSSAKIEDMMGAFTKVLNEIKEVSDERHRQDEAKLQAIRDSYEKKTGEMQEQIKELSGRIEDLTELLAAVNRRKIKKYLKKKV